MSEKRQETARDNRAVKDQAAEWLWRQQVAQWRPEDQAMLDAWLAESRYHLAAYWRLKAAWGRTERLAALKPGRMQPAKPSAHNRFWSPLRFSAAAACAVVGLLLTGAYWTLHEDTYATAIGQHATISLADGSQVHLNTDSEISVNVGMWGRSVKLKKGEAFFKIHHDAARPFTVLALGHRVIDLGTEFAVRTFGDRLEVTLVEGRARLETANPHIQQHAAELIPGEVAVATANSMSVAKVPTRTLATALAWRQGKVIFSHITLAEAAAEFNRYNSTKLIIEPEIADLKISGTFDAASIGPFTTMAKLAFGLRIQKREHEIIVSREKS